MSDEGNCRGCGKSVKDLLKEELSELEKMVQELRRLISERIGSLKPYEYYRCEHATEECILCLEKQGSMAMSSNGFCVGCGKHVRDLLREEIEKHLKNGIRPLHVKSRQEKDYQCDEYEMCMTALDRYKAPRVDENDEPYSLWGRVKMLVEQVSGKKL